MAGASHLIARRLGHQLLVGSTCVDAAAVVRHLGAVQAQDYAGATWALAQRAHGVTAASVDAGLAGGRILRTHVLRPTWHLVTAEDIAAARRAVW